MNTKQEVKYVDMVNVIGHWADDYGIPFLSFDDLITLGQYAVRVYEKTEEGKKLTFSELCELICNYIETPFGKRTLINFKG